MLFNSNSNNIYGIPYFARIGLTFIPAVLMILCVLISDVYTISESTESLATFALTSTITIILTTLAIGLCYFAGITLLMMKKAVA